MYLHISTYIYISMDAFVDEILIFEILHSNDIIIPLSLYQNFVQNKPFKSIKKCLALCHGHKHPTTILSKIKGNCHWYMVDIDVKCFPDYVCDVSNEIAMSYFPDKYFDVIVSMYFPVGGNPLKYTRMLKNISRIIKPTGKIYLTEMPGLFFWFMDETEYCLSVLHISQIIGKKEMDKHTLFLLEQEIIEENDIRDVYKAILVGNYNKTKYHAVNKFIKKKSIQCSKKYLNNNNYFIYKQKHNFLVVGLLI
jgi:hypothetical protein